MIKTTQLLDPRDMEYTFQRATEDKQEQIWQILNAAILRRKEDGSAQWQDGYPNPTVIANDIEKGNGYVLLDEETVIGYCAVLINDEPAYADIKGQWLTNGDFVVFHRVAIAEQYLGRGLSKLMLKFIEEFAKEREIQSIKVDTNFDNPAMMAVFEKAGYHYCGEVSFRGSPRRAYEKVIDN